ncbi:hypothetical protein [Cytobacillus sp.]|uniref:hypothetical protein n=1 Tax=Cytobacillus sp. TaxID=2675269 RepID=UPI0028BD5E34|nr:hypothetical protein [Cytobacillus sp.]
MTEFIIDISNIPTEYTIYASFLLGMIVKFIWVWKIEYHFYDSLDTASKLESYNKFPIQQLFYYKYRNPLLIWMIKCIRKKQGPSDDPEGASPLIVK